VIAALAVPILTPLLPAWHLARTVHDQTEVVLDTSSASMKPADTSVATSLQRSDNRLAAGRVLLIIWLSGSSIAGILLIGGGFGLTRFAFRGKPVTSERWLTVASQVSLSLGLRRPVRLLRQSHLSMLETWGIFRGRILIPHDAESWCEERMRIVLSHEIAHIKRFDWFVQIVAEIARAVYWFNPLFWIACKHLRRESEHACDDAVLNLGIDGQTYAVHLLELARSLRNSDRAWPPVLAMAQPPNLERRFIAMLNPSLNHRPTTPVTLVIIAIAAICLTLPLAAVQLQQGASPAIQSVSVTKSPAVEPKAAVTARQEPLGAVSGTVFDSSGAVIPGADVTLSNLEAKTRQSVSSNDTGTFEFSKLGPGRYVFEVNLSGFTRFRSRLFELHGNQRFQQNVTLNIGNLEERVTVVVSGTRKAAAVNTGVPRRIRVGGNVQAANLVYQVKPIYPQSARDAGVEGTVRLHGTIGADGSMLALQVLNEGQVDFELANAARGAVSQWRYRPTLLNGVPVEVLTTIEVEFKLSQQP